uniref:Secreted protein n=1 Tax=Knipowitschia caucasica TaxID=637954 RepID=A0AAV2JDY2_KNICA
MGGTLELLWGPGALMYRPLHLRILCVVTRVFVCVKPVCSRYVRQVLLLVAVSLHSPLQLKALKHNGREGFSTLPVAMRR